MGIRLIVVPVQVVQSQVFELTKFKLTSYDKSMVMPWDEGINSITCTSRGECCPSWNDSLKLLAGNVLVCSNALA